MPTESLRVLIVAKTHRAVGACIGALATDGRSLRLEAPNAAHDEHSGLEYHVGDVWEIEAAPHPHLTPPHVETVVVYARHKVNSGVDPIPVIERFRLPLVGGVDVLYEGLVQAGETGGLYVAERSGVPARSTLFWRPDRPLRLLESGVRLHYGYPSAGGEQRLTYVGFQEPLPELPAGTLLRVSLAHWWRPPEYPQEEQRCHLQLSGWFLPPAAEDDDSGLPPRAAPVPATPASRPAALAVDPGQVRDRLKDVFGYERFRPLQEEIVCSLLEGKDTLAVMPTGAGKSLCYQLPALLWPQLTVVVAPLISLMQDQVDALHALGVAAAYLNSSQTYAEQRALFEQVHAGQIKLLYVAPETLTRPEVLHLLDQAGVSCLAIDEAHCISSWGHDFRPEYRQLEPVRRRFAGAVCLAMTATAAPRVRDDIKQSLGIPSAGEFLASFDRPNLFLAAQPRTDGMRQLLAFLAARREQSGIIYCTARRQVDELAAGLKARGYSVLPYHAGLDDGLRRRNQRAFVRDEVQIVVATVAFGMGIDKSNVRFVVHYNMPSGIESYYQEIGRSGRDGLRADCLLLYSMQDVQMQGRMIDEGAEEERPGRNARLQAMLRYAQARTCRRPPLLRYFGEETAEPACGFCDNCSSEGSEQPQTDVSVAAQKFFSCVVRTGEAFGAGHIIDVLRGSRSKKVLERRHDQLPTYAIGQEYSAAQWRTLVQQWIQQQLLEQDMQHGGLRLTEQGRAVLRGKQPTFADLENLQAAGEKVGAGRGGQAAQLPAHDAGLFEHLRSLRRQLADASGMPPYIIFSDRALTEMAAYLPQSPQEFLRINGVGRAKLDSYGDAFIGAIVAYSAAHGLQPQPRPADDAQPPLISSSAPHSAGPRALEVGELYRAGHSLAELQEMLGIKRSTVITHLRSYVASDIEGSADIDPTQLAAACTLPPAVQAAVLAQFDAIGSERLAPVYDNLQGAVEYDDLHLLRLVWQLQQG